MNNFNSTYTLNIFLLKIFRIYLQLEKKKPNQSEAQSFSVCVCVYRARKWLIKYFIASGFHN